MFSLRNAREGTVHISDSFFLVRNESRDVPYITIELYNAVLKGDLICSPALSANFAGSDLRVGTAAVAYTTGTPASPSAQFNGTVTLSAITDVPTAASATATLAVELNKALGLIAALINRVEALENPHKL